MKCYLGKISVLLVLFFVSFSLILIARPAKALDFSDITTYNSPKTNVSGWTPTIKIDTVYFPKKTRLCFDYSPTPLEWGPYGSLGELGTRWIAIPGAGANGGWLATSLGPVRSGSDEGTTCGQMEETVKVLTCDVGLSIQAGVTYGFFMTSATRGETSEHERSDIATLAWAGPTSDGIVCDNIEPPPTGHYSCVSAIGGGTQYCSNDATGKYTTSNCDNDCPPASPVTRYSCVKQACFVDPNGLFSNCAAALAFCTTPATEAKPPVITKIQPTTAPVAAQILVSGSDLGGVINLLYPDGTTSVSFNGYLDDASKTLVKFDVPSDLSAGIYKVRGFGWGKYDSEMAVSPQDLTINVGGDDFTGTVPIGVPEGYQSLGELIVFIFAWSLRLLGITVFVMIFYAGVLWMTAAGNTSQVGEAKKRMTNAVLGAILLLSAYLILYTVNPDLVGGEWKLPGIGQEQP